MQKVIVKITWIATYLIVRFTIKVIWPIKIVVSKSLAKITGPVIIISNLGQQEEIQKGLKMGAADYLIKANVLPGDIIKKIKMVLGK